MQQQDIRTLFNSTFQKATVIFASVEYFFLASNLNGVNYFPNVQRILSIILFLQIVSKSFNPKNSLWIIAVKDAV